MLYSCVFICVLSFGPIYVYNSVEEPPSVFHGHTFFETLQVAIIAGSSPEIYQTVRMNCRSFLSPVRISVRPSKLS